MSALKCLPKLTEKKHSLLSVSPYFFFLQIIFAFIVIISTIPGVRAEEKSEIDKIIDVLSDLTCETQGVGDLIRSEFAHTCISASYSSLQANIVSPGLYANTLLKLKMNDQELFPDSCKNHNRVDYYDQKLSFALCSNTKLAGVRTQAIANSASAILQSVLGGTDPWSNIAEAWNIPSGDYHEIYRDIKEGQSGVMFDAGSAISLVPWKIIRQQDKLCVATVGFSGWIPVGCKYIKEPFPFSIYADFMSVEGIASEANEISSLTKCAGTGGCYHRAHQASQTGIVMSGPLVECIREMIAKLMISEVVCSFDEVKHVLGSSARGSSALFQFQRNMHTAVTALLTIYVILFGFKVILTGDIPPKSEFFNFIFKFIFVIYFAIGININPDSGDDTQRLDGMIEWALPFLLDGMVQITSWVTNATPSGLCTFLPAEYPEGMGYMATWDTLDCKIAHYLGIDMIGSYAAEMSAMSSSNPSLESIVDHVGFPIPPYLFLALSLIIVGLPYPVIFIIAYVLLVISVGAFLVVATIACMIAVVVLSVLAPIFVPMLLFKYTRGYFEYWLKLLIAFMLQPMIAALVIHTMFAVYDAGFYRTCKYASHQIQMNTPDISVPIAADFFGNNTTTIPGDNRQVKYFYIDKNWDNYTPEEARLCRESLGYALNYPMSSAIHQAIDDSSEMTEQVLAEYGDKLKSEKPVIEQALEIVPGLFTKTVALKFERIKKIIEELITSCLVLYVMYHFSKTVLNFAVDMTDGVSIEGFSALKPDTLYQKAKEAAAKAASAAASVASSAASGSGDSVSMPKMDGDDQADDMISGGKEAVEGAKDMIGRTGLDPSKMVSASVKKENLSQDKITQKATDGSILSGAKDSKKKQDTAKSTDSITKGGGSTGSNTPRT